MTKNAHSEWHADATRAPSQWKRVSVATEIWVPHCAESVPLRAIGSTVNPLRSAESCRCLVAHGVNGTSVHSRPSEYTGGHHERDEERVVGELAEVASGRWQARYPGPDGETYTARTEDDKSLTFLTKTDARRWLAAVHTKISLGQWESPTVVAARNRADAEEEKARSMGFEEYSKRWLRMIRTEPNRTAAARCEPLELCAPTRGK